MNGKKAVVIGGSNGIGLSISRALISTGYEVEIMDLAEPDGALLPVSGWSYTFCNLTELDEDLLATRSRDESIELLMITAGIGRIAEFQYFHPSEIEKTITVDTVAAIKICRIFYDRLLGTENFYCGMMGSIAGWLSSPAAAVYAAAKAGLVRFIESVNIELETAGSPNRILDVSPGHISGTRFDGGNNDLTKTAGLAGEILAALFSRQTRFIPEYEETYKAVLERYHDDPHGYGLHSYIYKQKSGRIQHKGNTVIGYLSGTFDLFHIGHLNLLRNAKRECDYLIVGVHNSGAWKGKETFIPFEERLAIVGACQYVDKAVVSCTEDSDAWDKWHYNKLFVGSDYKGTERFRKYEEYFRDKGVEIIYFPYTQSTSSTQIRDLIHLRIAEQNDHK